ncbi:MAG: PD-(D/E)XK nuclease family protein [Muribaculaceae bacterium]|nr:PD-(D/E)XK nuclease family protein [Muribaculaceae bacterium]
MQQFLDVIARGYQERYPDLSRLTFVMPNKRSGSFLTYMFKRRSADPVFAPRVLSITEFVASVSEKVQDSRLDLLFMLYDCYKELVAETSRMPFERFSSWGETILSDFNEIDMQMVPPGEIFKNVRDLNAIRSTFLTEEQKRVMVDYFGYSRETVYGESKRFWEQFAKGEEELEAEGAEAKGVRRGFVALWQLLGPLYRSLHSRLAAEGLTTGGGAYREVAEKLEEEREPFAGEKLIFVGFNALSESERRMFEALRRMKVDVGIGKEPKADFIWDVVSPVFSDKDDPAVKFVVINRRNFPSPTWLEEKLELNIPTHKPKIEVIAVPSNIMQAKVAHDELVKIASELGKEKIREAKVALVLPDENLLLPVLYSLPEEYSNPNLTMGFPLKHTPVISFAALLRRLHRRSRLDSAGSPLFFFEDVKDILAHPYATILFGRVNISKMVEKAQKERRILVGTPALEELGAEWKAVFRYIPEDTRPTEVIKYITGILAIIRKGMERPERTYLSSRVEKIYIATYTDALVRLDNCISKYSHAVLPDTVFHLADRLIAGETVAFKGEPLEGLQVMGVLETRCLDFERIIMLSVNEKVMPRVGRNTTYIPNAIRVVFGMPPANYQEEIFAYYFFRVLGRCTKGVLTYDSRASESRTPGPSRYLLQMKYLGEPGMVHETEKRFGMPGKRAGIIRIEKSGEVAERLRRYIVGSEPSETLKKNGQKNFSASALNHYCHCQLEFLYNNVMELYIQKEKMETIDAMDMGTIVHSIIEHLYIQDPSKREVMLKEPELMTAARLEALLRQREADGELLIEKEARRAILTTHFGVEEKDLDRRKLRGSAAVIVDYIIGYVRNIIRADIAQAPFRLWGTEIKETMPYRLPDGREVNLKMVIDRLDQAGAEGCDQPFRIVDYKTGNVHLTAKTPDDIFNGAKEAKNILQLLLYSELFAMLVKNGTIKVPECSSIEDFISRLEFAIYKVLSLPNTTKGIIYPKIAEKTVKNIGELRELEEEMEFSFMEKFDAMLMGILDTRQPFEAEPTEERCLYCDYKLRCEMRLARQFDLEERGGGDHKKW